MNNIAIDCTGLSDDAKQYVQEAFFKMGHWWSTPGYRHLHSRAYAIINGSLEALTKCSEITINEVFPNHKLLTFNELMELADCPWRMINDAEVINTHYPPTAESPSDEIHSTLAERGNNYGSFETGSELMQGLKRVAHNHPSWQSMPAIQREAIDMILHKIGRAINGNHQYRDNWIDIEGYARLVSDMLK